MQYSTRKTSFEDTLVNQEPAYENNFARIPIGLIRNPEIDPQAFRLYCNLVSYAFQLKGCFPGQERLAREMGLSKSYGLKQISKMISKLQELKLVKVERPGQGRPNIYYLLKLPEKYLSEQNLTDKKRQAPEGGVFSRKDTVQRGMSCEVNEAKTDKEHNSLFLQKSDVQSFSSVGSFPDPDPDFPESEGEDTSRKEFQKTYSWAEVRKRTADKAPQRFKDLIPYLDRFFGSYLEYFEEDHPRLKKSQWMDNMKRLDEFIKEKDSGPDEVLLMINKYFEMEHPSYVTDYNLNHFCSKGMLEFLYEHCGY